LKELLDFLSSIQKGAILDTTKLKSLLSACWEDFDGSNEEGMVGHKLHGRMQDVFWDNPILSFTIERHGGTVLGSTRAERHLWEINIDQKTASCHKVGYRQMLPRQPSLNVRPIAEEIVQLIVNRQENERLKWNKDGSVRVQIGKIFPTGSAVKQTLASRRKRFREMVDGLIINAGWQKIRANVYSPPVT
jgi:hypothetical protein